MDCQFEPEAEKLCNLILATQLCTRALYIDREKDVRSQAPDASAGQMAIKLLKHAYDLTESAIKPFVLEPYHIDYRGNPALDKPIKEVILAAAIYAGKAWGEAETHIWSELDDMKALAFMLGDEGIDNTIHGMPMAEALMTDKKSQMNDTSNKFVGAEQLLNKATDLYLEVVELWGISDDELFEAEKTFTGL